MSEQRDIQQCEVFLRAVKAFSGIEESIRMWEQCRRHEWAAYEWDTKNEEIRLRNPHRLKVVDLSL